ncbi:hypothetical protein M0804_012863 [Polistes exclamans]|nr:hypothetical protein M0804_012863 [Polistes exclamans]
MAFYGNSISSFPRSPVRPSVPPPHSPILSSFSDFAIDPYQVDTNLVVSRELKTFQSYFNKAQTLSTLFLVGSELFNSTLVKLKTIQPFSWEAQDFSTLLAVGSEFFNPTLVKLKTIQPFSCKAQNFSNPSWDTLDFPYICFTRRLYVPIHE